MSKEARGTKKRSASKDVASKAGKAAAKAQSDAADKVEGNGTAQAMPGADDAMRADQAQMQLAAATFGGIINLMMQSPAHSRMALGTVRDRVYAALSSNQFRVAEAKPDGAKASVPVAVVMWARVSDQVHQRLIAGGSQPRLTPAEWTSGDHIWLVEALGQQRFVNQLMRRMMLRDFKGREVHYIETTKEGAQHRTLSKPAV